MLKVQGEIRNPIDAYTAHKIMLVHYFITSCLDYCNSLLVGIPKFLTERLQKKIQNEVTRSMSGKKKIGLLEIIGHSL